MCGIAGLLGAGADRGTVTRMIAAIAHRGPNGVRLEAGDGYAFGHARLSIIDLECGWQPLHAAGLEVMGNGEIYNYLELSGENGLAERLTTGSDFEPLLHLFAERGMGAVGETVLPDLRGMYALCLRSRDHPALLARDPFGIKPLYVRRTRGPTLAFASEPRALLLDSRPSVAPEAAEELLALNYVVGRRCIFQGVERVAPGEVLDGSGGAFDPVALQPAIHRLRPPVPIAEAQALRRLDAVLEDSVAVHQRSDVPYGLFLSGGVDSAAIATLMARLNTRRVIAYTCGFDALGASDERGAAERVARALDLDWRETRFGAEDFWRIAPEVAWALDDPTTDFATLPTWKLAEAAKDSLTVVLTGEGGDELFGGYGRYRRALRPRWLGGRPAEPQVHAPFLKGGGAAALRRWREATRPRRADLTRLQQAQVADMATWLPDDLLLKLDRCLMAHGLEGRTPFLDAEVAAFALLLPDRLKVRGRHGKWLLRRWLALTCPAADAFGRKKGFTVPVEAWIAPRARALGPRVAAVEGVRELCMAGAVEAAFCDDAQSGSRWPLLFYALWWTIHIAGASRGEAAEAILGSA
ncbi:asparagine synthase (glutamine-hydrolyzing) [Caulobacter sp. S45]|uniref:asparagine synthase (glutamine-hydrolyzing) n=1 Tax=Caulobacter sp. S45 TaxID=1641861 RepID=UPI001576FCE0|nr:asparagine synthase (glutamine-hydrolyzing) [Caulobacter sp. S45]